MNRPRMSINLCLSALSLVLQTKFFLFSVLCVSVCENGWRCCLINRDRKMPTDYIRNGVLYVTEK